MDRTGGRPAVRDDQSRHRQADRPHHPGVNRRCSTRQSRRPAKPSARGRTLSGHVRARYLYALARQVQKHARRLAVLEIARQRQADPRNTRPRYSAGGAPLLPSCRLGATDGHRTAGLRSGRRRRADHPLELPAADAGLEDRASPGHGQHRRAQTSGVYVAHRAGLRRNRRRNRLAARRAQRRHRRWRGRARRSSACATSTRSPSPARPRSDGSSARRRQAAASGYRWNLAASRRSSCSRTPTSIATVEGVVDAIWFNQGQVCCAGSRLLVQEGIAPRFIEQPARTYGAPARRRSARQSDRHRSDHRAGPTAKDRATGAAGPGRRRDDLAAFLGVSNRGLVSTRRRCSPTCHQQRPSPRSKSSVRCWSSMTFRTPAEAVALANNTRYGLAASVWSENINLALDVARKIKAGTVWINSTNLFDAASGFGGYRESGLRARRRQRRTVRVRAPSRGWRDRHSERTTERTCVGEIQRQGRWQQQGTNLHLGGFPPIDRTPKLYIGGKQVRPDSGYSRPVLDAHGDTGGRGRRGQPQRHSQRRRSRAWSVGLGVARPDTHERKSCTTSPRIWRSAPTNSRTRIDRDDGRDDDAAQEVEVAIERLFTYAAWADKYDGAVHNTPVRSVTLAVPEPIGVHRHRLSRRVATARSGVARSRRPSPWVIPWSWCHPSASRSARPTSIRC